MCAHFDSLPLWWISGCSLTELAEVHGIPPGLSWVFYPLSQFCILWLLVLSPAYPGRPSSPVGGAGTCGVHRKWIFPCGCSCKMCNIPTCTCNLWGHRPIPVTHKLVSGCQCAHPGGVLVKSMLLYLALCVPLPVAFDGMAACLLAYRNRLTNTLHVGVLFMSRCINSHRMLA